MTADEAIAHAVRLLEAAETDTKLAVDWGAYAGLADSWMIVARLLHDRESE